MATRSATAGLELGTTTPSDGGEQPAGTAATKPDRMAADRAAISACVVRCAAAKDGRGRWKAEDRCADALQATGTAPALADQCAAAARRIGTWLSTQGQGD